MSYLAAGNEFGGDTSPGKGHRMFKKFDNKLGSVRERELSNEEADSFEEDTTHVAEDLAHEVIDGMLELVIESKEGGDEGDFLQRRAIENVNGFQLKKKLFVRERLVQETINNVPKLTGHPSVMSEQMLNQQGSDNDFIIAPPADSDPSSVKTRIYFFSTPKFIEIQISKKNKVEDVIKHIITLYKRNSDLSTSRPLKFPDHPDAYELRLIDDDEAPYAPFFEIQALEMREAIGEFDGLAFIEKRGFKKPSEKVEETKQSEANRQKEIEGLLKNNKRLLVVEVNTSILKTRFKIVMNESDQMYQVLEELAKKVGETFLNPRQYLLVPLQAMSSMVSPSGRPREESDPSRIPDTLVSSNPFPALNDFSYDSNFIDLNSYVRNLKTNMIELREKIYVDKPVRKVKEIPIENQHALASTFTTGGTLNVDLTEDDLYDKSFK